jgi:cell division protein FtsQ
MIPLKKKERFRNFLLTNQVLRQIRKKFYRTFLPRLIKFSLFAVVVLLVSAITLKISKPAYFTQIHQKFSSYFFHRLNLHDNNFLQINISGNERVSREEIISIIDQASEKSEINSANNQSSSIQNLIDEIKSSLPWIHHITIARSMPNSLNISVTEYKPFAIWQNNGKKYIIDKDGNTVPFEESPEFETMVILSGNDANIHAHSLFNIFTVDPNLNASVYSATWVGSRRWDIRFENGLLVKLPERNISKAWQRLIKIYNMPGSISGLRLIDLRLDDRTYLEYEDAVIKELKSL